MEAATWVASIARPDRQPSSKRCFRPASMIFNGAAASGPTALMETTAMATIQIRDEKKYAKAIGLLYEMGGLFRTKPTRQLVIGPFQLQVLQQAGLVPHANGA